MICVLFTKHESVNILFCTLELTSNLVSFYYYGMYVIRKKFAFLDYPKII